MNADEILGRLLREPGKVAITQIDVDGGKEFGISYQEFYNCVVSLANYFYKELSLKPGDCMAYMFENCPEVLIFNIACLLSGLKVCPLDSKRDLDEVASFKLEQTEAKIFFKRSFKKLEIERVKTVNIDDYFELKSLIPEDLDLDIFKNFSPEKPCLILYTSGTTGHPKGAMLSFENLFYGAKQVGEWFKISAEDIFFLVLPLHHINSTTFSNATIFSGGSLVISSRYSRSRFLSDASKYKATMSSIVATINIDLIEEEFDGGKTPLSFKYIQIGSAPVSPDHVLKFYKKFGVRLVQGYGSTETSLRATGVPVDLKENDYLEVVSKNSIGKALSENKVVILDGEDNVVTEPGEAGEIGVSGRNVMLGYLNEPEESGRVLRNGYFHTGDSGYFEKIRDEEYLFIKGRIKEIIIKGGVNISPVFIEEVLRKNFDWARDFIVVGFPDFRFGEEIAVVALPKNENYGKDLEETRQILREHKVEGLSNYETPKVIITAREEEIPRTATGKIQKVKVKELFRERIMDESKLIGRNESYLYRIISPDEVEVLKQAVEIHNQAFPKALGLDPETIIHRATNGFVIGAFQEDELKGVLTGFRCKESLVKEGKLWSEITGNGKFTTFDPRGETALLCSAAAITSVEQNEDIKAGNVSEQEIREYIDRDLDFVVKFHKKAKAGFAEGAHVYRIILNGNPADLQSLRTIVCFEYPPLESLDKPQFTENKIGLGLVEAAIIYAKSQGMKKAIPLSRLGEAYKHIA